MKRQTEIANDTLNTLNCSKQYIYNKLKHTSSRDQLKEITHRLAEIINKSEIQHWLKILKIKLNSEYPVQRIYRSSKENG